MLNPVELTRELWYSLAYRVYDALRSDNPDHAIDLLEEVGFGRDVLERGVRPLEG